MCGVAETEKVFMSSSMDHLHVSALCTAEIVTVVNLLAGSDISGHASGMPFQGQEEVPQP